MFKARLFGLILLWLAVLPVQAQTELNQDLQLQKLFEIALLNNPTIQLAEAKQSSARSQHQQADALNKPQLMLQSELSYAWMQSNDFPRTANQLKASYPLYQPDKSDLQSIAQFQESAAQWQLETQRQLLLRQVAENYYQYWSQQAQVDYLIKEQQAIQDIMEQIQQRFQVGYQDLNDIAEIQARLDANQAERLLAVQRLQIIEANLAALLGHSIELSSLQPPQNLPNMKKSQARQDSELAHPQIQQLKQSEKAANKQVEFEKHKDGIQLEAFGAYVYNESDGNFYDDMQGVRGGLQLTLPLYVGGRTDANVSKARAESQQLKAQQREIELALQAQSKSSWLTYQAGLKRLEALKAVLYSSEQALKATENGLRTGTRNILDLLNAQRRLHLAQRDIPMTKAQIWQAWYKLQWAQGKLNLG